MTSQLLILALITSLKILFVYEAMKEGMILFPLRQLLEGFLSLLPIRVMQYLCKPMYCCLFCMSSVWGTIFTAGEFAFTWSYLQLLLIIGGINYMISVFITLKVEHD